MKKLLVVLVIFAAGCVPSEAKRNVRNKHAELYVYVKRLDDPDPTKRPTKEENETMIRSIAKDYESFDMMMNNWKPNPAMGTTSIEPANQTTR